MLIAIAGVSPASATKMTGDFDIANNVGSSVQWVDGNGIVVALGSAVALDFSPDTNNFVVTGATGSFIGLVGTSGAIRDFRYSGPGGPLFPSPPISSFLTLNGFTFDLTSITLVVSICPSGCSVSGTNLALVIQGTGVLRNGNALDDTPALFQFTAQGAVGQTIFPFALHVTTMATLTPPRNLRLGALGEHGPR